MPSRLSNSTEEPTTSSSARQDADLHAAALASGRGRASRSRRRWRGAMIARCDVERLASRGSRRAADAGQAVDPSCAVAIDVRAPRRCPPAGRASRGASPPLRSPMNRQRSGGVSARTTARGPSAEPERGRSAAPQGADLRPVSPPPAEAVGGRCQASAVAGDGTAPAPRRGSPCRSTRSSRSCRPASFAASGTAASSPRAVSWIPPVSSASASSATAVAAASASASAETTVRRAAPDAARTRRRPLDERDRRPAARTGWRRPGLRCALERRGHRRRSCGPTPAIA